MSIDSHKIKNRKHKINLESCLKNFNIIYLSVKLPTSKKCVVRFSKFRKITNTIYTTLNYYVQSRSKLGATWSKHNEDYLVIINHLISEINKTMIKSVVDLLKLFKKIMLYTSRDGKYSS